MADHAPTSDLVASPLVLRFCALVDVSVEELLIAAGLEAGSARAEVRGLRFEEGMRLWERLEELTADPFVGLTAGSRASLDSLGMLGLAFSAAADLTEGLRMVEQTLPQLVRNASIRAVFEPERGGLIYRPPSARVRHGVDAMFAAILSFARHCVGGELSPCEVSLRAAPPRRADRYREVLGVAPTFSASACRLFFRAEDLRRPFRGADPRTAHLLVEHAAALLRSPPAPSLRDRIERALLRSIDGGDGSLQGTAAILEVSPRTLQRYLTQVGVGFRELRLQTLRRAAERYLRNGMEIDEVAVKLGYASRSSFERAFRSWQGESPASFRARESGAPIGDDLRGP